ncbi:MAG: hypothetical protein AB7H80_09525 [Candidatus Kapaibacterium sp.]
MPTRRTIPNYTISLIGTLVLLLIAPEQGRCQSQLRLGPMLGYYLNQHTSTIPILSAPDSPHFPSFTGSGLSFGLQAEYYLDRVLSISADVAYNDLSGSSEYREVNPTAGNFYEIEYINDGSPGFPIDTTADKVFIHSATATYRSVSLGFSGKWRFVADSSLKVGLQLGCALHMITSKNYTQNVLLENPLARFVNPSGLPVELNGKKLFLYNGDIPDHSPNRFGLRAGIFAEMRSDTSRTLFSPGIYYEYGATPVQKSSDWYVHRLGVQLALLFRL